jgi:hypothetical protein
MSQQFDFSTLPKGKVLVANGGGELLDPFPDQKTIDAVDRAGDDGGGDHGDHDEHDDHERSWTDERCGRAEWSKAGADLLIECQPATAVYWNGGGAVVIRQEGDGEDEDRYIFIQPHYVSALIAKLQAMAKEAG